MSTRAIYTVIGEKSEKPVNIYIHSDGYPTGAADHIRNAFEYAWPLPRFEADEFAAALVAGNKKSGGGVRIFPTSPTTPAALAKFARDIEYRYEIYFNMPDLHVWCFATNYWDAPTEKLLFRGTLEAFDKWAKDEEKAREPQPEPVADTWIIKATPDSDVPPPSGGNKRFTSEKQARKVAAIMAAANPGKRFVVYKSTEAWVKS